MFLIAFTDAAEYAHRTRDDLAAAQVVFGDEKEDFLASLAVWSREDYEDQWRQGASRIVEGSDISCLVGSVDGEAGQLSASGWVLYREDDVVVVQEHLLSPDGLSTERLCDLIEPRITHTESGAQISEWTVRLGEIDAFVRLPDAKT
jgi:hypothetical protein